MSESPGVGVGEGAVPKRPEEGAVAGLFPKRPDPAGLFPNMDIYQN
mgnify:CR=1 FL=1